MPADSIWSLLSNKSDDGCFTYTSPSTNVVETIPVTPLGLRSAPQARMRGKASYRYVERYSLTMPYFHSTADVADSAQIGEGAAIWDYAKIREDCRLGENVIIGRGVYIGPGVRIDANCKIQNYALIYEPAILEAGVFIGPGVILTNDEYPRAVNPDGSQKGTGDWQATGVKVREGASIGAGSICVAPVEIGAWSLVAAGSTVVDNVPAFALVAGIPARRMRWVGKSGVPLLNEGAGYFVCPKTGTRYLESAIDTLVEVTS